MITKEQRYSIDKCTQNICKNFNIPARLNIGEAVANRANPNVAIIFIDAGASASIASYEFKRVVNIKSPKDYRRLRTLIKARLINAIRDLKSLTEESLENLGK